MSVNVKLGNNTINGVNVVRLEDATTSGTYHNFNLATSGMYTIQLNVDNVVVGSIEIAQGESITQNPYTPSKSGYMFLGWAETSGGSTLITYPYTPQANGVLYAVWQTGYKCVVTGLGSSNTSSVGFQKDAGFTLAGLGIEEITKDGDTFIKIPTMYRKVNSVSSNQITSFTISSGKIDNDYQPYPCFLDESGGLLPYVLIGKYYSNSSTRMQSVSNTSPTAQTIGNARTNARNRGTGYQLYDWQIQKLWQDLIICFKTTINTNSGTAWTYDELGIYWGTSSIWIDGIVNDNATLAFSYKPSKYIDNATSSSDGYQSASYSLPTTNSQEIQALGYDSSNPFLNCPKSTTNNSSYNTYYCDYYSYSSGNLPVRSVVGAAGAHAGAFGCDALNDWTVTLGVRLCYRPLSA